MPRKLIVVSLDSFQSDDLEALSRLPLSASYLRHAALIRRLRPIYPTLTYPIHTTLITGHLPQTHGIPHNQKPGITRERADFNIMGSDWYWSRQDIQTDTLFDAAHEAGLRVGTILWPANAHEKRYFNMPEIWPTVESNTESLRDLFKAQASEDAFTAYFDRYVDAYDWSTNTDMVFYGVEMAIEQLKANTLDVLFLHDTIMDHMRHIFGVHNPMTDFTRRLLDSHVARIIEAAGGPEAANFIFLGDHGQIDVAQVFHPNILLVEAGLITLGSDSLPEAHQAYCFSAGFSCHIYVDDETALAHVASLLKQWRDAYPHCIEKVYTAKEVREQEGLQGGFAFVLEGTRGTLFGNNFTGALIASAQSPDYKGLRATHGHHPDKAPFPALFALGPDIDEGIICETASQLDLCPSFAKLLNLSMPGRPGKPLPFIKS